MQRPVIKPNPVPQLVINDVEFGSAIQTSDWAITLHGSSRSALYVILGKGAWFSTPYLNEPLWCPHGSSISVKAHLPHAWQSTTDQRFSQEFAEFPIADKNLPTTISSGRRKTTMLIGRASVESAQVFIAKSSIIFIPPETDTMRRILDYLAIVNTLINDPKSDTSTHAEICRTAEILVYESMRYWLGTSYDVNAFPVIGSEDSNIYEALTALHAKIGEKWTTERMARIAGLSRSAFVARFKTTTGKTLQEYLIIVRLREAQSLIDKKIMPLHKIAVAVGYGSQQAFIHAFQRHFGITPGAYKRGSDQTSN